MLLTSRPLKFTNRLRRIRLSKNTHLKKKMKMLSKRRPPRSLSLKNKSTSINLMRRTLPLKFLKKSQPKLITIGP